MAHTCITAVLVLLAVFGARADNVCTSHAISSNDYKYNRQTIPGALQVTSVEVVQQNSNSPCTLGATFGSIGPDVWVSNGCRAVFKVCFETGYTTTVRCESQDFRDRTCGTGGYIRLLTVGKQLSKTACTEGSTFFKSATNIIVTRGCRADFLVGF